MSNNFMGNVEALLGNSWRRPLSLELAACSVQFK